jgi:PKD repeat protein
MMNRLFSERRLSALALTAILLSGCTVGEQKLPDLAGPSELGLGMSLTARPEFLPRDGSSVSTITAKTFDSNGKALPNQRIMVRTDAGLLSASEVVTDGNGVATFTLTAPGLNENVSVASIYATPIQNSHVQNANSRIVQILVSGPAFATPSFTVKPTISADDAVPPVSEPITFDASATAYLGGPCGGSCSYSWDFGDGSSVVTGQAVQHAFNSANVFTVKLTVTAPGGTTASVTKTVTIAAPAPPVASFIVTPASPTVNVAAIFNGSGSTVGTGATISQYVWDFGDGGSSTTTIPVVSHTYTTLGAKAVTLTVTDSIGRTNTITRTLNVVP